MQGPEQNVFQDFKEPKGSCSLIGITGFICQREFKEARLGICPKSVRYLINPTYSILGFFSGGLQNATVMWHLVRGKFLGLLTAHTCTDTHGCTHTSLCLLKSEMAAVQTWSDL